MASPLGSTPKGSHRMQCFFVQFRCALGRAYDVATALADSELASEIYSTSGEYDLLAKFYVDDETDIGRFVNANIHSLEGIERTLTTQTSKEHSSMSEGGPLN